MSTYSIVPVILLKGPDGCFQAMQRCVHKVRAIQRRWSALRELKEDEYYDSQVACAVYHGNGRGYVEMLS